MEFSPHLLRQLDIIPMEALDVPITLIGSGAVGSFAAIALAKMGFEDITAYDDDIVKPENLNCQFFRFEDIEKPKVQALAELIKSFANVDLVAKNERFEEGKPAAGIVITAVDSMASRAAIWKAYKNQAPHTRLYVDPRMGAETALCYAVLPNLAKDIEAYEASLYSDEDAVAEPCTAKATSYTALSLASHVAKVVKDFVLRERYPRVTMWDIKKGHLINHFQEIDAEVTT